MGGSDGRAPYSMRGVSRFGPYPRRLRPAVAGALAALLLATSAACADPADRVDSGASDPAAVQAPSASEPRERRRPPRREVAGPEERAAWLATLVPVESGPVRLLVPEERAGEPALRELAGELARAVESMAARLPVAPENIERIEIAVEPDLVAQAVHAGAIGPMVAPSLSDVLAPEVVAQGPDLHLVLPGETGAEEDWVHHFALARHLLARWFEARPEGERPSPWLLEGVALWLAGGSWYSRATDDWVPLLAAADVLPTADELLAPGEEAGESDPPSQSQRRRRRRDESDVLSTPAAAAVVALLPGRSAVERLAAADRASVTAALARLVARAVEAPEPPSSAPLTGELSELAGFQRGVSLAMLNSLDGGYHAPSNRDALERLAALGANSVSIMPFAFQRDPREPELGFRHRSPRGETDAGLIHAARTARSLGFTVLWKPHVWVGHESWPGEIEMTSEEDWAAWWRSYRRYVLHHAALAAHAGAEMLALGVELEKTVERRSDWVRLARDARRFFPGALTYAANWGSGADRVSFWDAVDLAGVDAYYPLAPVGDGELSDRELTRVLEEGAERVAGRLAAVARRAGKPLLLTEVGFPARTAAWSDPHREGEWEDPEDEASQARAYRALLAALDDRPWLRGVYVWKAFSAESSWRGDHPDFRFLDRPAEAVVGAWFRRVGRD